MKTCSKMDLVDTTEKEHLLVKTHGESLIDFINSDRDDHAFRLLNSGQKFSQDELDHALISACNCRYKLLIYKLVHLGADAQAKDIHGNTPLLICAELRSTNTVRFLLGKKVNINATNDCGNTALILAIRPTGSIEMVQLLLAQTGINVNHQNKEGYTAVMKAIELKDVEVIKLLLDSQDNTVEVLDGIKNSKNETAQQIADKLGIEKITKLLSKYRIKEHKQVLTAVRACDVNSFNNLLDHQLSDPLDKCAIISDAFMDILTSHNQSGQTFNESEEKIIQRLLECGAGVDGCSYRLHPVEIATQVGSYNVLQMLLKHLLRLDKPDIFRVCRNPLRVAAANGRLDLIELLLNYDAKRLVSTFGYSALECALRHGHTDCAKLLVAHGVVMDVNCAFVFPENCEFPVYFTYLVKDCKPEIGQFAFTSAIRGLVMYTDSWLDIEMASIRLEKSQIIERYANYIEKGPFSKSHKSAIRNFLAQRYGIVGRYRAEYRDHNSPVVHFLSNCHHSDVTTKAKTIKAMLNKNNSYVNKKSFGGRTPLMVAVSNGESTSIVHMLLKHGAEIDAMDSKGNTVLLLAVENNHSKNILCVLQHVRQRSVINFPNRHGLTPLMIAAQKHNYRVMEALIDCKAQVNAKDINGNTALLLAVSRYSQELEVLNSFVNTGSHTGWQKNCGFSSFSMAAKASLRRTVKLLVIAGADVNIVNKKAQHETALTLLLKNISLDDDTLMCMEYLLEHGAKASYANPLVIHTLIKHNKVQLIPKLIQCGFGPVDTSSVEMSTTYMLVSTITTFSPLYMALMTGNVKLARHFVEILFVTKSDVTMLVRSQFLRTILITNIHLECLQLINEIASQPMPLFSLAFIAVQSAVGTAPGREDRVNMLPLPKLLIDRLLHKTVNIHLGMKDVTSSTSVGMTTVDPRRTAVPKEIPDDGNDADYELCNYVSNEEDSSDEEYLMGCGDL